MVHRCNLHLAPAGGLTPGSSSCLSLDHAVVVNALSASLRSSPPFTRRARMILAILLASATATTLNGRRVRSFVIQSGMGAPRRACFRTAVAPKTSSFLGVGFPIFDILQSRSLRSHAAKCRPETNPCGSATSASIDAVVMEPTPGMVINRRISALPRASWMISRSSFPIRLFRARASPPDRCRS